MVLAGFGIFISEEENWMKKLALYLCSSLVFVSVFGVSSLAIAGGHGGKKPIASPKEQQCIKLWQTGKKQQFSRSGCCQLAMSSPLPPKNDPIWKDKKERKMLNMLRAAKQYCAKQGFKPGMPPHGKPGMPPHGKPGIAPHGGAGMPPHGKPGMPGMPPMGKPGKVSKVCAPGKGGRMERVSQVLSEAKAISYVRAGSSSRTSTGFNNKSSVVCVRGKKVPVRVGNSPSQSNLGQYIRGNMQCMLRKNKSGKRVAKLLCN
jgi:hypothetical protein